MVREVWRFPYGVFLSPECIYLKQYSFCSKRKTDTWYFFNLNKTKSQKECPAWLLNRQDYELGKTSCRLSVSCALCFYFLHSSAKFYARTVLSRVYFEIFQLAVFVVPYFYYIYELGNCHRCPLYFCGCFVQMLHYSSTALYNLYVRATGS